MADLDDRMLTRREAADFLGMAEQTLAQWTWRGEGPPVYRYSRRVRYRLSDLNAWVAEHRVDDNVPAA